MKLINKAIRELTEERVKKIKFSKGIDPKGVAPLKPKKSSGDTSKVGAASDTTKKGSWAADQDITTGEHYDELDKANKRMKKYDNSISGDYDDDAKDVVKVHETDGYDLNKEHPAEKFYGEMFSALPSSEVDRLSEEFLRAQRERDWDRMHSLVDQIKAHNHMAAGGQVSEGVSRILQLAGVKDVREMLVVHPKKELDEEGKNKKKNVKQEHGLIEEGYWDDEEPAGSDRDRVEASRYKKDHHKRFVEAVNEAGLTPYHYQGRWYYEGPAVDIRSSERLKLYAALHEAGFDGDDLQKDNMGMDEVVYPRN